ncbi:ATP-grasp domain-containing protein [Streptomyces sp. NPDC055287]
MDAVWVLNYPQPSVQTEAWQLLWRLNARVPFVVDVTGILMPGNKTNLPVVVSAGHLPDTLVSAFYEEVEEGYRQEPDASWVVKPTDDDAGADVYLLQPGSSNNRVLLQSLTGSTALGDLLAKGRLSGYRARYCALQEYVPHREEKRVILAAGRPAAALVHRLAPGEHRGNTAHQAACAETALSADETRLCTVIAERLARHGVRFAGLDLAYPYVFEANLVSPGGLEEIVALGLPDATPQILRDLFAQDVTELAGVTA